MNSRSTERQEGGQGINPKARSAAQMQGSQQRQTFRRRSSGRNYTGEGKGSITASELTRMAATREARPPKETGKRGPGTETKGPLSVHPCSLDASPCCSQGQARLGIF